MARKKVSKTIRATKSAKAQKTGKPTEVRIRIYNEHPTDSSWVPVLAVTEPGIGRVEVLLVLNNTGRLVHVYGAEPQPSIPSKIALKILATRGELYPVLFDLPQWAKHTNGQLLDTITITAEGRTTLLPVRVRK